MGSSKVLRFSFCQFAGRGVQSSGEPVMAQPGGSRMLSKRVVVVLFCLFTLLLVSSPVIMGQSSSTGTITGIVTDSSGAAVPGATVYLADTTSGSVRPTTTTDKGLYAF